MRPDTVVKMAPLLGIGKFGPLLGLTQIAKLGSPVSAFGRSSENTFSDGR
jgi:hypothetical protein